MPKSILPPPKRTGGQRVRSAQDKRAIAKWKAEGGFEAYTSSYLDTFGALGALRAAYCLPYNIKRLYDAPTRITRAARDMVEAGQAKEVFDGVYVPSANPKRPQAPLTLGDAISFALKDMQCALSHIPKHAPDNTTSDTPQRVTTAEMYAHLRWDLEINPRETLRILKRLESHGLVVEEPKDMWSRTIKLETSVEKINCIKQQKDVDKLEPVVVN